MPSCYSHNTNTGLLQPCIKPAHVLQVTQQLAWLRFLSSDTQWVHGITLCTSHKSHYHSHDHGITSGSMYDIPVFHVLCVLTVGPACVSPQDLGFNASNMDVKLLIRQQVPEIAQVSQQPTAHSYSRQP